MPTVNPNIPMPNECFPDPYRNSCGPIYPIANPRPNEEKEELARAIREEIRRSIFAVPYAAKSSLTVDFTVAGASQSPTSKAITATLTRPSTVDDITGEIEVAGPSELLGPLARVYPGKRVRVTFEVLDDQ